jgi:hypothetical protein
MSESRSSGERQRATSLGRGHIAGGSISRDVILSGVLGLKMKQEKLLRHILEALRHFIRPRGFP